MGDRAARIANGCSPTGIGSTGATVSICCGAARARSGMRCGCRRKRLEADVFQDLRYGVRMLGTHPGFAAVAIVTLALGIGANTAIFSIMDRLLIRTLPVDEPHQLVAFVSDANGEPGIFSYPAYANLRDQNDVLSGLVAFVQRPFTVSDGTQTERVTGEIVSGNYFDVLGVRPAVGRFFLPEEDRTPGVHAVVVIGHALWRRRFGADPGVLGKAITVNAHRYTIVGVAPSEFKGITPGHRVGYLPAGDDGGAGARGRPGPARQSQLGLAAPDGTAQAGRPSRAGAGRARRPGRGPSRRTSVGEEAWRAEGRADADGREPRPHLSGAGSLPAPDADDGRGRVRAADRLRECREPAAGARLDPEPGNRRPPRRRRQPSAHRAPDAHRKRDPRRARRRRGTRGRVRARRSAPAVPAADQQRASHPGRRLRRPDAGLHAGPVGADRHRVLAGAGAAGVRARPRVGPQEGRRRATPAARGVSACATCSSSPRSRCRSSSSSVRDCS